MPTLFALGEKLRFHLCDEVRFFLPHRFSKCVCLSLGESRQFLRKQHHLLLVNRDAIGLLQVFFARVYVIGNLFSAVLPSDKGWNVLEWPRSVQGVHGDEVAKNRRLQFLQVFLHARGLVLENSNRFAPLKQLVCFFVVQWESIRIQVQSMAVLDVAHCIFDDGQRLEPQEVHFEQSSVFCNRVVELCARHVAVFGDSHGDVVGNVRRRDDDATRMNACVAQTPLEDLSRSQGLSFQTRLFGQILDHVDLLQPLGTPEFFLERLIVKRKEFLEADVRHELRNAIGFRQWQFHHACSVSNGALCCHGTVGDDLGDLVGPVFVNHIINHFSSPLVIEVNVNIGQAHPVRIEKTLK